MTSSDVPDTSLYTPSSTAQQLVIASTFCLDMYNVVFNVRQKLLNAANVYYISQPAFM